MFWASVHVLYSGGWFFCVASQSVIRFVLSFIHGHLSGLLSLINRLIPHKTLSFICAAIIITKNQY